MRCELMVPGWLPSQCSLICLAEFALCPRLSSDTGLSANDQTGSGSAVSDAIVLSYLGSTATKSCSFGYFNSITAMS